MGQTTRLDKQHLPWMKLIIINHMVTELALSLLVQG
jgi:hypothetical protein